MLVSDMNIGLLFFRMFRILSPQNIYFLRIISLFNITSLLQHLVLVDKHLLLIHYEINLDRIGGERQYMEECPIQIIGKCWLVKSILALSILLKRKLYKSTDIYFFLQCLDSFLLSLKLQSLTRPRVSCNMVLLKTHQEISDLP